MKINIYHRFSGRIIFFNEQESNTPALAVKAAIKAGADLSKADLRGANLRGADLRGAAVCYSYGWQFSCSHSRFKVGISFVRQVLAHLCSCTSDDPEFTKIREMILPEAQKSHRAADLGILK